MAEESTKNACIEETLFQLLQTGGARSMDQGSLLVLLSLVNLMGIIDIINFRLGIKKNSDFPDITAQAGNEPPEGAGGAGAEAGRRDKAPSFDPAAILSMLGRKEGSAVNHSQLADLFNRFMPASSGKSDDAEKTSGKNHVPKQETSD